MCGIFAYIGKRSDAAQIVLSGLKTLEYRGYDSWGIAARLNQESGSKNHAKLAIEKHVGKIGNATLDSKFMIHDSNLAIGHTRWATHGGVTDANAHPHLDCTEQIALIHNGIIENYQELRNELTKKGHNFKSETDTEVAIHLIEEELKTNSFADAVRLSFNKLSGMNAVVVIDSQSSEIIAAKNGSPLVIGIGQEEFFLASDAAGILEYTKDVLFLEDHNMVVLNNSLELYDLSDGSKHEPKIETLEWSFEEANLGEHKHFFIKEIHEEPKIVRNIALNGASNAKVFADLIDQATGTFLIACGSASYAATAATYLFSKIAKKHVNFAVGSEFKYIEDFIIPETLVIPISQSGESIDVIEPTTKAKKGKGAKIASIVNVLGSTLYRLSDHNFLLEAGPEKAVVATKSFSAMVAAILLVSYTLANRTDEGKELLLKASENISAMMNDVYINMICEVAEKIKNNDHVYVIGRGVSYAAALETTLKIKEASYAHAEAFPGGELKHGVIALIEKGTPCIVFAPNDETYEEIVSNAQEIRARGGYIIGVGPRNNEVFDSFLETDDIQEATILPQVTVAHLLGYYLALARGNTDPDKPRNLAKSVTVK